MVGTPPFYRYSSRTGEKEDSGDEDPGPNQSADVKRQNTGPLRAIDLSRDVDRQRHGCDDPGGPGITLASIGAAQVYVRPPPSQTQASGAQTALPQQPQIWPPPLPAVPTPTTAPPAASTVSQNADMRPVAATLSAPPVAHGPRLTQPAGMVPARSSGSSAVWEQQAKSIAQLRAQLGLPEARTITATSTMSSSEGATSVAVAQPSTLPSPQEMLNNMKQLTQEWRNGAPSASSSLHASSPTATGLTAAANGVSRMSSVASDVVRMSSVANDVVRMSSVGSRSATPIRPTVQLSGAPPLSAGPLRGSAGATQSRSRSTSRAPSVERMVSSGTVTGYPHSTAASSGSELQLQPASILHTPAQLERQIGLGGHSLAPAGLSMRFVQPSTLEYTEVAPRTASFGSIPRSLSAAPKSGSFRSTPRPLQRSLSLPGSSRMPAGNSPGPSRSGGSCRMSQPTVPSSGIPVHSSLSQPGISTLRAVPGGSVQMAPAGGSVQMSQAGGSVQMSQVVSRVTLPARLTTDSLSSPNCSVFSSRSPTPLTSGSQLTPGMATPITSGSQVPAPSCGSASNHQGATIQHLQPSAPVCGAASTQQGATMQHLQPSAPVWQRLSGGNVGYITPASSVKFPGVYQAATQLSEHSDRIAVGNFATSYAGSKEQETYSMMSQRQTAPPAYAAPAGAVRAPANAGTFASSPDIAAWTWGAASDDFEDGQWSGPMTSCDSRPDLDSSFNMLPKRLVHL